MTSGGFNFNDFPESQLNKFHAVYRVLRQIGTTVSYTVLTALNGLGSVWNSFKAKEENILATPEFFSYPPKKTAPLNRRPCSAKQFEHA